MCDLQMWNLRSRKEVGGSTAAGKLLWQMCDVIWVPLSAAHTCVCVFCKCEIWYLIYQGRRAADVTNVRLERVLYLTIQIWFWSCSCSCVIRINMWFVNVKSEIKEAGCVPGKLVWRIRDPLPSFSFLRFASLSYSLNSPANIFLHFSFCPNFHLIPLPIIYLSYFVSIFYCAVYILTFLQIPNKSKFSLTDWCTQAPTFPEYP